MVCKDVGLCDGEGKCRRKMKFVCNTDEDCLSNSCFDIGDKKVCKGASGESCTGDGSCASGKCNSGGSCD